LLLMRSPGSCAGSRPIPSPVRDLDPSLSLRTSFEPETLNPDSIVGTDRRARHNLSAVKSTGSCLSAFIDPHCVEKCLSLIATGCESAKINLKLRSRTPSLLQDYASLSARLGLTAESGLKLTELHHGC
jgi:hypothetical protein